MISESGAPGGCALNTACVLSALGVPVSLGGSAVGRDAEGTGILSYLDQHGLEHGVFSREGHRTQRCYCLVSQQGGERSFVLSAGDVQWFGDELIRAWVPRVQRGEFSHLFVQPYVREASMRLLEQIQTTSAWILIQDVEAQDPAVPLSNGVQLSLPASIALEPETLKEFARPYFRGRCEQTWLTAGARGVAVVSNRAKGKMTTQVFPGVSAPAAVVDTTGCGDAFRAGAMAKLFSGDTLESAIEFGQRVGAYQATIWGSHFIRKVPEGGLT